MAYQSIHSGPELDATISLIEQIQTVRDEVAADLAATQGAAADAATSKSQADAARNEAVQARDAARSEAESAGDQASQASIARAEAESERIAAETAAISAEAALLSPMSRAASTSGDTWTDLVTGAAVVLAITLANKSFGTARVSMRMMKGSTPYELIPDDALAQGASARLALSRLVLEAGDKLQVKSVGGVDWVASGGRP